MKFEYETNSGMNGHVEAVNEREAVVKLAAQYGPEGATLIEATAQAPAPAATAPTAAPGTAAAPAVATAGDPHGWAKAFATAAAR